MAWLEMCRLCGLASSDEKVTMADQALVTQEPLLLDLFSLHNADFIKLINVFVTLCQTDVNNICYPCRSTLYSFCKFGERMKRVRDRNKEATGGETHGVESEPVDLSRRDVDKILDTLMEKLSTPSDSEHEAVARATNNAPRKDHDLEDVSQRRGKYEEEPHPSRKPPDSTREDYQGDAEVESVSPESYDRATDHSVVSMTMDVSLILDHEAVSKEDPTDENDLFLLHRWYGPGVVECCPTPAHASVDPSTSNDALAVGLPRLEEPIVLEYPPNGPDIVDDIADSAYAASFRSEFEIKDLFPEDGDPRFLSTDVMDSIAPDICEKVKAIANGTLMHAKDNVSVVDTAQEDPLEIDTVQDRVDSVVEARKARLEEPIVREYPPNGPNIADDIADSAYAASSGSEFEIKDRFPEDGDPHFLGTDVMDSIAPDICEEVKAIADGTLMHAKDNVSVVDTVQADLLQIDTVQDRVDSVVETRKARLEEPTVREYPPNGPDIADNIPDSAYAASACSEFEIKDRFPEEGDPRFVGTDVMDSIAPDICEEVKAIADGTLKHAKDNVSVVDTVQADLLQIDTVQDRVDSVVETRKARLEEPTVREYPPNGPDIADNIPDSAYAASSGSEFEIKDRFPEDGDPRFVGTDVMDSIAPDICEEVKAIADGTLMHAKDNVSVVDTVQADLLQIDTVQDQVDSVVETRKARLEEPTVREYPPNGPDIADNIADSAYAASSGSEFEIKDRFPEDGDPRFLGTDVMDSIAPDICEEVKAIADVTLIHAKDNVSVVDTVQADLLEIDTVQDRVDSVVETRKARLEEPTVREYPPNGPDIADDIADSAYAASSGSEFEIKDRFPEDGDPRFLGTDVMDSIAPDICEEVKAIADGTLMHAKDNVSVVDTAQADPLEIDTVQDRVDSVVETRKARIVSRVKTAKTVPNVYAKQYNPRKRVVERDSGSVKDTATQRVRAKRYNCPVCDMPSKSGARLTVHYRGTHRKRYLMAREAVGYNCAVCKKRFASRLLYKEHERCHAKLVKKLKPHGRQPGTDGQQPEADGRQPEADGRQPEADGRQPDTDGRQPDTPGRWSNSKARPCPVCTRIIRGNNGNMTMHIKSHKVRECHMCDLSFQTQPRLTRHLAEVHGIEKLSCPSPPQSSQTREIVAADVLLTSEAHVPIVRLGTDQIGLSQGPSPCGEKKLPIVSRSLQSAFLQAGNTSTQQEGAVAQVRKNKPSTDNGKVTVKTKKYPRALCSLDFNDSQAENMRTQVRKVAQACKNKLPSGGKKKRLSELLSLEAAVAQDDNTSMQTVDTVHQGREKTGSKVTETPKNHPNTLLSKKTGSKVTETPKNHPNTLLSKKTGSKVTETPKNRPNTLLSKKTGSKVTETPKNHPNTLLSKKTGSKVTETPKNHPNTLLSKKTGSKVTETPKNRPNTLLSKKTGSKVTETPKNHPNTLLSTEAAFSPDDTTCTSTPSFRETQQAGTAVSGTELDSPYACNLCPESFVSQSELSRHATDLHLSKNISHACRACKAPIERARHSAHLRSHGPMHKLDYVCNHCNEIIKRNVLFPHVGMHTHRKPFKCGHCSKLFAYAHMCSQHVPICKVQADYSKTQSARKYVRLECEMCGITYRRVLGVSLYSRCDECEEEVQRRSKGRKRKHSSYTHDNYPFMLRSKTSNVSITVDREQDSLGNTNDQDPPVNDQDPPASEQDPPVNDQDPPASDQDPPASEQDPPASAQDPPASALDPPGSAQDPPASALDPPASDQDPPASEQDPPGSAQDPPASALDPPASDQDPPASDQDPPASEQDPPSSEQDPPGSAQDPPASALDPPASDQDPPASDQDPPASEQDPPASALDPPASDQDPPASEQDPPASALDPPASDKDPPASEQDPPASVLDPPASDQDPPASEQDPPSSEQDPPGSAQDPPASALDPPASDQDPPASDQDPPSSEQDPPASEQDPPADSKEDITADFFCAVCQKSFQRQSGLSNHMRIHATAEERRLWKLSHGRKKEEKKLVETAGLQTGGKPRTIRCPICKHYLEGRSESDCAVALLEHVTQHI